MRRECVADWEIQCRGTVDRAGRRRRDLRCRRGVHARNETDRRGGEFQLEAILALRHETSPLCHGTRDARPGTSEYTVSMSWNLSNGTQNVCIELCYMFHLTAKASN